MSRRPSYQFPALSFYDPCGRKIAQFDDIIASNVTTGRYVIRWQYDSMDNIIQLTEQDRKITSYEYELGKLKTKVKPDGVSLDYTYDIYERVKMLASSDDSIAYEYIYDNNDNDRSTRSHKRTATKRTYNSNQLLVSETLANGQKIDYQYHNGQLALTLFQGGTSVVYHYDGDNLTSR